MNKLSLQYILGINMIKCYPLKYTCSNNPSPPPTLGVDTDHLHTWGR